MAFFKRTRQEPAPASDFWGWWQREGRAGADAVVAQLAPAEPWAEALTSQLHAVVPGMAWELASGDISAHVLVISAGGDPSLRAAARRMILNAPAADEMWSFRDLRVPAPDPESVSMQYDGTEVLGFADFTVTAHLTNTRFNVVVNHPRFAALGEQDRMQLTFLALDAALGELDVECWIGEIRPSEVPPIDGFGLSALRAVVLDLKSQFVGPDGDARWTMMQGTGPQGPVIAAAMAPLTSAIAPNLDTHVAVIIPYAEQTEDGFPGESSLAALRQLEDRINADLGFTGRVVAHQSSAGTRVLHVYVDSTSTGLDTLTTATTGWPDGRVELASTSDPAWQSVQHLRG